MRPSILCHERLLRIQRVLNRAGGKMSVRGLRRSFAIWPWEVEQAASLGWLKVYMFKREKEARVDLPELWNSSPRIA